jgi:hypothetical protein
MLCCCCCCVFCRWCSSLLSIMGADEIRVRGLAAASVILWDSVRGDLKAVVRGEFFWGRGSEERRNSYLQGWNE